MPLQLDWTSNALRSLAWHPAHLQAVTCLAFSDSGSVLVTGGEDTLVNAWLLADVLDATAGQQLQVRSSMGSGACLSGTAVMLAARRVAVSSCAFL